MTTDLSVPDLQEQLWDIYELYYKAVVLNPNWQVDDCIEIPAFANGVDSILLSLVCMNDKRVHFKVPFLQCTHKQANSYLFLFLRLGEFQWFLVVKRPIGNAHLNMIHFLKNGTIAAIIPPALITRNVT